MNPIFRGPPSSQEKAYSYLKERIASFAFRPSQRLKAMEIAEKLGVSRTPVKEALGRLEQEGLVRRELGSGYVVQALSVRDILNLYRVREVLEVEAALEAVPNITTQVIDSLQATLEEAQLLLQKKNFDQFLRANRRFHNAIAGTTGNDALSQILAGLNDRIWSIGSIIVRKHQPRAAEIHLENQRILKALAAKDLVAVEATVRAHIRRGGAHVKKLFADEQHNLYFAAA